MFIVSGVFRQGPIPKAEASRCHSWLIIRACSYRNVDEGPAGKFQQRQAISTKPMMKRRRNRDRIMPTSLCYPTVWSSGGAPFAVSSSMNDHGIPMQAGQETTMATDLATRSRTSSTKCHAARQCAINEAIGSITISRRARTPEKAREHKVDS